MTISRTVIPVCLVLVAIVFSSLMRTTEGSWHNYDDVNEKNTRNRHRHRHEGMSIASSRRNHDLTTTGRETTWPKQDDDYADFSATNDDDEVDDDDDYEIERSRKFNVRDHETSRNKGRSHRSRFEPRYSMRHHRGSLNHGDHWHRSVGAGTSVPREEDPMRRRLHYEEAENAKGRRSRPGPGRRPHNDRRLPTSGLAYPTRYYEYEDYVDDDDKDDVEMPEHEIDDERSSGRSRFDDETNDDVQAHRTIGKLAPSVRHHYAISRGRQEPRKIDRKSRIADSGSIGTLSSIQRSDADDWTERRRKFGMTHRGGKRQGRLPIDEPEDDTPEESESDSKALWGGKRSRNKMNDRGLGSVVERKRIIDDAGYRDYEDVDDDDWTTKKLAKRRKEVDDEEEEEERDEEEEDNEEEENVWKDIENIPEDDEDTFDNTNYYKTEDEPPYKTYDDIIKSLTSNDPTTSKPLIRRDYRNIGIEKYLKRDAYGNIYDSRNATLTRIGHDRLFNGRSTSSSGKWRFHEDKPDITSYSNARDGRKLNAIGDVNGARGHKENDKKRVYPKLDEASTRTKSLEQEYDEDYENSEKDEDAAKIGEERVTEMQSDINNAEYLDEDNEMEIENETSAPIVTLSTTTATTSTTTTTTTTPRPTVVIARTTVIPHDRRDSRSHDNSSGSQSNGLQQQQQSVHSLHKWQSSTTRDSAKDPKGHGQKNNNRNGKSAEIKEALQHAIKVSREGSCQWPRARVIPVRDVYPSPSTTYIPHCAILHRCSDDTGCCRSEALTCVPKVSHRVELYFYTNSIGGASVVEKLSFYNHTECECKERDEYGATVDKTSVTNEHRFTRHHAPAVSPPQNIRRPPQRKPCRCPSEFTARETPEGECQCNCYEKHKNCFRTRHGKGYFSLRDRLCIQNEECATPVCEFGEYMRRQGKCPRKKDKFDAIANHPSNVNLHYKFRS